MWERKPWRRLVRSHDWVQRAFERERDDERRDDEYDGRHE
jgi:hypothetical protein